MTRWFASCCAVALVAAGVLPAVFAQECRNLYGIHDHEPRPSEFLGIASAAGQCGWVTATVAVGANPSDMSGADFSWFEQNGHTVICRINYDYCVGTIPLPEQYAAFAQRCANFVAASTGCHIWLIGNETNLAVEWPIRNGHKAYVTPQSYASCFRQAYNAIKAVRPGDDVICQAIAPWGGPYGPGTSCGATHDGVPINWVQYMNQMLVAIQSTGGLDGIAVHIGSRGYRYEDIHSTQTVSANGQTLYFSFYTYKDWVNLGIPPSLYHLPLYATESNGLYYWKGGHPENPAGHYEAGWMQEVFAEIDRYNQQAAAIGKPTFRCINFYRWCPYCDGWNIDGADNPYKAQIMTDLAASVAHDYEWPDPAESGMLDEAPTGVNHSRYAWAAQADSQFSGAYDAYKAIDGIVSVASKWASASTAPPHWLAVDLGEDRRIHGYIVRHAGAAGEQAGFNTQQFEIQSGPSLAGPWTTETIVSNAAQQLVTQRKYRAPKTLRYFRLYITDPGVDNFARIPEFEVWAGGAPLLCDWAVFAPSMQGPQGLTSLSGRLYCDEDGDHDVDLRDFVLRE